MDNQYHTGSSEKLTTTLLGTVVPNNGDNENWTVYCERRKQFFLDNDVKDADNLLVVLLSVRVTSIDPKLLAPKNQWSKPS